MKFIIILIALGFEKGLHAGDLLFRFNWFDSYLGMLRKNLESSGLWKGYAGVALAIVPLLIVVGLVYYLLCHLFYGIVGFVISLLILLYCFGPTDLYAALSKYFIAHVKGDTEAQRDALAQLLLIQSTDLTVTTRALTKTIFVLFNDRIFAVLFWFAVLGPVAAVLYRLSSLLDVYTNQEGSEDSLLASAAQQLHQILDWIPTRLLGLGFSLVGSFVDTFSYWLKHVGTGIKNNTEILEHTGLLALELDPNEETSVSIEENNAALALVDRTLIIYLVVMGVFVLGAWLY